MKFTDSSYPNPKQGWPQCTLMVGAPFLGKSDYIEATYDPERVHVASPSHIIQRKLAIINHNLSQRGCLPIQRVDLYNERWRDTGLFKIILGEYKQGIKDAIAANKDVIIDQTHLSPAARKKSINLVN